MLKPFTEVSCWLFGCPEIAHRYHVDWSTRLREEGFEELYGRKSILHGPLNKIREQQLSGKICHKVLTWSLASILAKSPIRWWMILGVGNEHVGVYLGAFAFPELGWEHSTQTSLSSDLWWRQMQKMGLPMSSYFVVFIHPKRSDRNVRDGVYQRKDLTEVGESWKVPMRPWVEDSLAGCHSLLTK